MFQSPKIGSYVCNITNTLIIKCQNTNFNPLNRVILFAILAETGLEITPILFQSPKSGHIVCNKTGYRLHLGKKRFQSPKSGHIVCNKNCINCSWSYN